MIMKINKLIPTIMISGHANVQLAVEAIRLGAYEFLEKPFSTEKINASENPIFFALLSWICASE